jgi:hypothetical protein
MDVVESKHRREEERLEDMEKNSNDEQKIDRADRPREYVKPAIVYRGRLEAYAASCVQKAGSCASTST